jgi:3-hydroxyacyl-CoA dehydrogenase
MRASAASKPIDKAMKLGANHPMGPLELADFIGLDTCLSIMQVLHEGLADSKYRPCPLLVKYVEAGWLGRKTQARLLRLPRRNRRAPPSTKKGPACAGPLCFCGVCGQSLREPVRLSSDWKMLMKSR